MHVFRLVASALCIACSITHVVSAPHNQTKRAGSITPSFPYGSEKVRGVNLGGWLVLEPWITPSLFENTGNNAIVDEWAFGQMQDRGTAQAALQRHWDTWITEQDFADIAAAGLNHVRLPIGYWAWDVGSGEPYIQGQLPYLRKAITWASNHGLKVIIDLHGAPGSQNGFDNSGQRLSSPGWQTKQSNVDRTNAVIKRIASEFASQSQTASAIEALNEPAGYYDQQVLDTVKQYYLDSYGNIRYPYGNAQQSNTIEVIHDAFQDLTYWNGWERPPQFQGVILDKHIYQMFDQGTVSQTDDQHIKTSCGHGDSLSDFDANGLWTVVGEWTQAMTDCAKYLNGRGVGARYDGSFSGSAKVSSCNGKTGAGSSFSSDYKTSLRKSWEAQVITFEKGSGWIQWTWKAENADDWSYQAGLKGGWIPHDPTDLKYPGICG